MRKILILMLFACSTLLFSQEKNPLISIEFTNASRKTVIEKIEALSNYQFYFDQAWLNADTGLISGNYKNQNIQKVLEGVFENTNLNFFIDKNKIILTNNSVIYNHLPENYFGESNDSSLQKNLDKPVFY